MNSKERLRTSLTHQTPDTFPVDFGAHRSSGIAAIAYARLKKALGITSGNIFVYDMVQQLAIVEPEVMDALGIDLIELGRGFLNSTSEWKDWVLPDGTPCKIPAYINLGKKQESWILKSDDGIELGIMKPGCLYFEQTYWPWADLNPDEQDFSDIEQAFSHSMWMATPTPPGHIPLNGEGCTELEEGARKLKESSQRAILGIFGGSLFEVPQFLYGIEKYFMHLCTYPEGCKRLSQALY